MSSQNTSTDDTNRLPRLLGLLDQARAAHRRETTEAALDLVDGLLATDRSLRRISLDAKRPSVAVTIENVTVRLAVASPGQLLALRELSRKGDVRLALGLVLDDGRAMLGFSGESEDVLITARIAEAA